MDKLRELQLAELDILKSILNIFEENNLKYFMLGGTFLGAVRHNGFIPWDDDIDIGMPRKDYEKFIEISKEKLPNEFSLAYYKLDKDFLCYPIKIQDKRIKLLNIASKNQKEEYAWIDVFPLDGIPKNKFKKSIHKIELLIVRAIFKLSCFDEIVSLRNIKSRPFIEKILIYVGLNFNIFKKMDSNKLLDILDKLLKKYDYNNSEYVVNYMGAYKFKEMFHKSIYEETENYIFEDIELIGPKDYDTVLSQLYGDYMKVPQNIDKNKHGIEIL